MKEKLLKMFQDQGFQENTFSNKSDKEVSPDGEKKGVLSKLSKISKTAYVLTLAAAIIFTGAGCAGTQKSFFWAASNGDIKKVEALLQEGVDANTTYEYYGGYKWTMLGAVSREGHFDVVKMLLDNGADVNAKDQNGRTALYFAKEKGHQSIVRLFLEAEKNN